MKGFLRSIDNRLPFQIERSVQQNRHTGGLTKSLDQPVVSCIECLTNGLQSAGTVYMRDRRNRVSLVFLYVHNIEHKPSRIVAGCIRQFEVILSLLGQNRWRERTKRLAKLD